MIHLLKPTILFLFIGNTLLLHSQVPDAPAHLENLIESILEELEEGAEAALIIEDLQTYAENPLNINAATRNQLSKLHLLDDVQIEKIINYLREYGPAYSLYELNAIDGFNPEILTRMEPFVKFGPVTAEPQQVKETFRRGKYEALFRTTGTVQKARGYRVRDDGTVPYEGNRARYYSRCLFQSGDDISLGITGEKDPGEAFFSGSNREGFDSYSGHASMKISPVIENIILGDFVVRSGQGLVIWQGFSTGKSLNSLSISKTNQGIRPYTSADENLYFRGISTTLKKGDLQISLFFSQKKSDANRAFSDSLGSHFTSLQTSGYHRTKNEIANKNSITDTNTGVIGTWHIRNLKIGATLLYRKFNLPFIRSDQLYNRFRFQGDENIVMGTDYLYSKGKYRLFGEGAVSKSKGLAVIQGATAHLHDRLQIAALYRHFDKNYHALWASPFAEGSSAANETGLYWGIRMLPVKYITLSAYSDIYRSEWIQFSTAGPSKGWDILAQADFRPSRKIQFHIRFKNEEKEQRVRVEEKYENFPEQHCKSRFHFDYSPDKVFSFKTRMEHVFYKGRKNENGWLVYQDIHYSPANVPLKLSARLAWFHTDSYNSRIYAYENDLLYSFSIPAYFDKGFRTYLNLKYKVSNRTEVWFKVANSTLKQAESIGSGYNEIPGNKKTELKFQMRLKI